MKKLIYALTAIFLLMITTSCQTKECECVIVQDSAKGGTTTYTKIIELEAGERCKDLEDAVRIPGVTISETDLDVNITCRAIY